MGDAGRAARRVRVGRALARPCSDLLARAAAAGAVDAFAANALAEATVAQPAIAALVAIGRGDQRAASLALGRCERAEQVRVVRIVSKAYAAQRAGSRLVW